MRACFILPLLAAAAPAWAAELNAITSVEVKDAGNEVVISVKGSRKTAFTTFSMADPPRFVIDFSESKFQGVPEEAPGPGGVVEHVKALSYGTGPSAIARVMVEFSAEVDPPAVEESADGLLVRVPKPSGAGAAVAAAPAAPAAPAVPAAAAEVDAKAKAEAQAKAEEERKQAQARADAEARAKADAEAQARADEEQKRAQKADAEARAKADAEAQARADEERRRVQKADAEAQARAKADAEARAKADAEAQARADEERRRAQKADADARARADADARATAEGHSDADQKALEAEIATARAESQAVDRGVESLAPGSPPTRIREVGFKQLPDASRVFVRTSAPTQLTIQEVDERTIRIEIPNSRATRHNDLRFMDTSFFSSAIQMITPSPQGTSYVLTVKLRQRVPYQQRKEGDMLAVDFQRPPSTAAASTPPPAGEPDSDESAPASEE